MYRPVITITDLDNKAFAHLPAVTEGVCRVQRGARLWLNPHFNVFSPLWTLLSALPLNYCPLGNVLILFLLIFRLHPDYHHTSEQLYHPMSTGVSYKINTMHF